MQLISVRKMLAIAAIVAATGWTLARPAAAPQAPAFAPASLVPNGGCDTLTIERSA